MWILALTWILALSLPQTVDALTIYSVSPSGESVDVGSYEPVGVERTAAEASDAVISITGYRDTKVYAVERIYDEHGVPGTLRRELGTIEKRVSVGSGFFITTDGYALTNRHVVDDPSVRYVVETGQGAREVEVVYKDVEHDLAVIKVAGTFPAIALAPSGAVDIGDEVASVGNALGRFVNSVSSGTVISLDETIAARDGAEIALLDGLIATDARLYPGDSGGPLLNNKGEAVGVNVAIIAGTDVSFSIPADITRSVVLKAGLDV